MRICQSGCFRLTLIQASIRRSYPFCSLYLPMLMILFPGRNSLFGVRKVRSLVWHKPSSLLSNYPHHVVSEQPARPVFYSFLLFLSPMPCDLLVWESPLFHQMQVTSVRFSYMGFSYFTLPSSSCVRKSNSRPNVLMTISGFKVFSQYSSFFLYRYIRVK